MSLTFFLADPRRGRACSESHWAKLVPFSTKDINLYVKSGNIRVSFLEIAREITESLKEVQIRAMAHETIMHILFIFLIQIFFCLSPPDQEADHSG